MNYLKHKFVLDHDGGHEYIDLVYLWHNAKRKRPKTEKRCLHCSILTTSHRTTHGSTALQSTTYNTAGSSAVSIIPRRTSSNGRTSKTYCPRMEGKNYEQYTKNAQSL